MDVVFGLTVVERSLPVVSQRSTTGSWMKPLRGVFFVPHGTLRVAENEPSPPDPEIIGDVVGFGLPVVSLRSTTGSWMKPLRGVFLCPMTCCGWWKTNPAGSFLH
ncbi:MAG: hypothetical protein KIH69_013620 [Anaerolineae bacterium]|nr:hypothetical protein [Anaerolineae bacterium]